MVTQALGVVESVAGEDGSSLPALLGLIAAGAFLVGFAVLAGGAGSGKGYMSRGEVVRRLRLDGGGELRVSRHPDLERQDMEPVGTPRDAKQEWRSLRFERCDMYLQGVTKVLVLPGEQDGDEPKLQLLGDVLSLPYNRSLAAVILATLAAIGAPVKQAAAGRQDDIVSNVLRRRSGEEAQQIESDGEVMRILCIGLGGGAVPAFLSKVLPRCHVDVVESEPSVVQAAIEAMGFQEGPRLRVEVGDGAGFAVQQTVEGSATGVYDAVVIDAYDAEGNVPEAMWRPDGKLVDALSKGLLKERGAVAVNFLPQTDLGPRLGAYKKALSAAGAAPGLSFSVVAEERNLMAVRTCGGPSNISLDTLEALMTKAAQEVQLAARSPFAMTELATRDLRLWDHS